MRRKSKSSITLTYQLLRILRGSVHFDLGERIKFYNFFWIIFHSPKATVCQLVCLFVP